MKEHLFELRTRILHSLLLLGLVFSCCFYFSNQLYSLIAAPILAHLPPNTQIITTQVTAPFMVPLQLSFLCALLLCAPYIIYQIWSFISPGLYKHERKIILPLLCSSSLLFYCGATFALLVICPVALKFFTSSAPGGVLVMLDIGDFLNFVVTIAVATGIAFQVPVVTNILVRTGIVSKKQLIAKRKHIIVLAFVLGMLLAPPDVFSQVLLAIPMWLLFELGVLFAHDKQKMIQSPKLA